MKLKTIANIRVVNAVLLYMKMKIVELSGSLDNLCFVIIMKGGLFTAYKILSLLYLKDDIIIGHIGLSSYDKETKSLGKVKITHPLDLDKSDVEGKDVWIIDDCIDSGLTLDTVVTLVSSYNSKSIRTAVLVDKKNHINNFIGTPDVVGITYEGDKFLVGCGMGKGEKYRSLLYLCELEEEENG